MFTLELRVGEFDLLEPFVLFAQQSVLFFGNFQADRELVFLSQGLREFCSARAPTKCTAPNEILNKNR